MHRKIKAFFPGTILSVYVASVALPSIRAQPATGRWEFPPANWWQWSTRQHSHEAPDCVKLQRPPTKQLEKDLFMIGSCIAFSCTHVMKYTAWWPDRSSFIHSSIKQIRNVLLISCFYFFLFFEGLEASNRIWAVMWHQLPLRIKHICSHSKITLILPAPSSHSRQQASSGAKSPKVRTSSPWSGRNWADILLTWHAPSSTGHCNTSTIRWVS